MSSPKRIQRKRTKGYRLPPNAVYVGRPTKWGNPFKVINPAHGYLVLGLEPQDATLPIFTELAARAYSVERYNRLLNDGESREGYSALGIHLRAHISELRGKDLACWCPLEDADGRRVPCHADVLLELANEEPPA